MFYPNGDKIKTDTENFSLAFANEKNLLAKKLLEMYVHVLNASKWILSLPTGWVWVQLQYMYAIALKTVNIN